MNTLYLAAILVQIQCSFDYKENSSGLFIFSFIFKREATPTDYTVRQNVFPVCLSDTKAGSLSAYCSSELLLKM